jgi:ribonuclease HI
MAKMYTDGSCWPKNPGGAGGWAYTILDGETLCIGSGGLAPEKGNTNNRMELQAIISGLERFEGKACTVYTDSMWALNGATGAHQRHANLDLWSQYDEASKGKDVSYRWVKGHKGDLLNEFVDDLAREEAIAKTGKKINLART